MDNENNELAKVPRQLHPWQPGVSGNPKGRPKKSEEEKQIAKQLMNGLQDLGDMTLQAIEKILNPENKCQAAARVRMIEVILSYILGKPSAEVNLNISADQMAEDSELRIAALIQAVKGKQDLSAGYEAITEAQEESEDEDVEP